MGNHTAGVVMGRAAEIALHNRHGRTALEILDEICEPWRDCDAEFEAEDLHRPGYVHPQYDHYTDPNGPLGILIAEAFGAPGFDYTQGWNSSDEAEEEEATDRWWGHPSDPSRMGPYMKFKARYEFC